MTISKHGIGNWKNPLMLMLAVPLALASFSAAQPAAPPGQLQEAMDHAQAVLVADLPDSPDAAMAQSGNPPSTQNTPSARSSSAAPQQQSAQKPVGTAAAEPTHANGVAASQPAGVAVSPEKQRRRRTIIIRVGAIAAAAVAVGTVVALSAGTSSRPPGAH